MKRLAGLAAVPAVVLMLMVSQATADMDGKMDHGKREQMEQHEHGKGGMMEHKPMRHSFGPYWRDTLTDEQKTKIDGLHMELKKSLVVLEAEKELREAELKALAVAEKPDMAAMDKKINEIVEIKRRIMQKKYGHIRDMRQLLTPEQRVTFDMGLLSH